MYSIRRFTIALFAFVPTLLVATPSANAHFLWLKSTHSDVDSHAVISFGESALEEDYKLPESVEATALWWRGKSSKAQELSTERVETDERIVLQAPLPSGDSRVLEATCTYGIYHTTLLQYYAKHITSHSDAELAGFGPSKDLKLDIIPQHSEEGLQLQVLWNGMPLPKASAKLTDSTEEEQTGTTDEQGRVTFNPPAQGLVNVLGSFVEKDAAGELEGAKYKNKSHFATLTFVVHSNETQTSAEEKPMKRKLAAGELPSLPEPIASFGAAVLDGWLYVYSGHTGGAHEHSRDNLTSHFRRTPITGGKQWEELPMQTPLQGFPLVAHDGAIYRVGGMSARNAADEEDDLYSLDNFARFDPTAKQWTALPALPEPSSSHDAVVIDNKLYVAGGWQLEGGSEGMWHAHSLVIDLADLDSGWQQLPEQPFERRALAASHWQGQLAVLGGIDSGGDVSRRLDLYDPVQQTWSQGPDLPGEGMSGFGVSAWNLDGKLYASGLDGSVYCLADDGTAWQVAGQLQMARFFHRLLPAGPNKLFAIGGASFQSGHLADIEIVQLTDAVAAESEATIDSE